MKTTFVGVLMLMLLSNPLWAQNEEARRLINEGVDLHDKRLYPAAIERYKAAIKLDPTSSIAYYEMAFSYSMMGESKKAIKNANKVIKLNNGNEGDAYMLKANLLDDMGKTEKALKTYETALVNHGDNYLMHFNYGISLARAGILERSKLAFLNGVQLNPSHPSGHYILGLLMSDESKPAQAIMSLYYFLLLETESERAENAYNLLMENFANQATKGENGSINININSLLLEGAFAPANTLIPLLGAVSEEISDKMEEEGIEVLTPTTQAGKNAEMLKKIFGVIAEIEPEDTTEEEQIWFDFYVSFYRQLLEDEEKLKAASYLVQANGPEKEVEEWLLGHKKEVQQLRTSLKN